MTKYVFIIMLVTVCFFWYAPLTFAQNIKFSMTPPLLELTIKPGKSVMVAYTVTNFSDPVVVTTAIRPFVPQNIYGELTIADEFSGPIRFNLENSNIALGEPFFLKTGQGQQLLLKMRVPEGTPEGDYYYTFLAGNEPGKLAEGTTQPLAQAVIGSNILITVTNTGVSFGLPEISIFQVMPHYKFTLFNRQFNIFESSDPIPVQLVAANKGKNLIRPSGKIILRGSFSENVEYEIVPENILSNASRVLHATPSADITDRAHSLIIKGFHVGKYSLTTSIDFGSSGKKLERTVQFYALPIRLLIATIIAIIAGSLIIKKLRTEQKDTIDSDAL